ncbi:MAG: hypothetical protein ACHP6H_06635 [Legionellales bacterium]
MGNFLKFIIGGLLVLGSLAFGFMLLIGGTAMTALNPNLFGGVILWGVIDFIVLLTGLYLMKRR